MIIKGYQLKQKAAHMTQTKTWLIYQQSAAFFSSIRYFDEFDKAKQNHCQG